MNNDPRSCERNLCNCVRSLKKIQDFNRIWTRALGLLVDALTNWAMKPPMLGAGQ